MLSVSGDDERWESMRPMHDARAGMACVAVGGCVIAAGGAAPTSCHARSVEVYEEALGRWRRLPCSLPDSAGSIWMGSALM